MSRHLASARPSPGLCVALAAGLGLSLALACAGDATQASAAEAAAPTPTPLPPEAPAASEGPRREAQLDPTAAPKQGSEPSPESAPPPPVDPFVQSLLTELRPRWDAVLDAPATYRFEFIVTQVLPGERNEEGQADLELSEHRFRADAEYIYPASAIKTYAAVAALRKLARVRAEHNKRVRLDTPLAFCSGAAKRCRSDVDESNLQGGTITLGHEIRKMLLVSNNTAFNRLMQFVGYDEFHADMRAMGFTRTFVRHPLWVARKNEAPRYSPGVQLRPIRGKAISIAARDASETLPPTELPRMEVGSAYLDAEDNKARVDTPMDFREKNFVSLDDFHRLTLAIVLAGDPRVPDLGLDKTSLRFMRRAMSEDPLASKNPVYTDEHKSALRYKPMLEGVVRVRPQSRIEYVNKAGRAYGFHLENAYVRDRKSGRAFVVTVAIYVNENGVLNDDLYQYDAISRPLLKDLGEVLARRVFDGTPDLGEAPPATRAKPATPSRP